MAPPPPPRMANDRVMKREEEVIPAVGPWHDDPDEWHEDNSDNEMAGVEYDDQGQPVEGTVARISVAQRLKVPDKERYLTEKLFQRTFLMTKDHFYALSLGKRTQLKQDKKLFCEE